MRDTLVLCAKNAPNLLRNAFLIPILLIFSNCAFAPDLLPGGAPTIAYYPGVRAILGKTDLAVVVTIEHTQNHDPQAVQFNWSKNGALIWGEWPGNTAAIWRFVLIAPGIKNPICLTAWTTSEETKATCMFKAEDYLGLPLIGEIDYWLGGEKPGEQLNGKEPGKDDPLYRISTRIHYLVNDPSVLMERNQ